ncbi:extracellular solute-binding protein [Hyperthermus butylicus]|uniref:ABC-type tungstate transport system, permease component, TupB n=1 Tax=Hyperthermus butylicus (strain DSM 5456 / JCM 9403 / PLM1-5) TaxID=415426 RepID=A2BJP6_HYPBU|nr:extracellular solute-binding protein [Hyperthermus butylicus]ABM80207.1 ABC-type tungstate transport system, permease component, TupB [Hyperthermus butylicus DSM 5456]
MAIVVLAVVLLASAIVAYQLLPGKDTGNVRVRATTTTSLYATGLLEYLEQEFRKTHPKVEIDFIPVGSGEALRRAAQGDACIVFVHAPSLEKEYIEKGVIEDGRIFAYNYFIIVGPADDPAGVRRAVNAVDAFRRIYEAGEAGKAKFVSRGDNSGTHVKELSIWRMASLDPHGKKWYLEVGAGMADTLVRANELGAYTLSDIGTYLKLKKDGRIPNLEILYSNSMELINIYSVYLVKSCQGGERKAAEEFAEFLVTHQDLIASYGVEKYGQPLFYPAEGHEDELARIWQQLAES